MPSVVLPRELEKIFDKHRQEKPLILFGDETKYELRVSLGDIL